MLKLQALNNMTCNRRLDGFKKPSASTFRVAQTWGGRGAHGKEENLPYNDHREEYHGIWTRTQED